MVKFYVYISPIFSCRVTYDHEVSLDTCSYIAILVMCVFVYTFRKGRKCDYDEIRDTDNSKDIIVALYIAT